MPGSETSAGIDTRTVRKVWFRILLLIFILYVVAFIDRINIGFAALTMNRELSITSPAVWAARGEFLHRLRHL